MRRLGPSQRKSSAPSGLLLHLVVRRRNVTGNYKIIFASLDYSLCGCMFSGGS